MTQLCIYVENVEPRHIQGWPVFSSLVLQILVQCEKSSSWLNSLHKIILISVCSERAITPAVTTWQGSVLGAVRQDGAEQTVHRVSE